MSSNYLLLYDSINLCHSMMSCCHVVLLTWILMCLLMQENNDWQRVSSLGMNDICNAQEWG